MKVPGFVHEETPFCGLCSVTQTKIGNYFEPVIPRNPNGSDESEGKSNPYQFEVIGGIRPSEARFPEYSDSMKSSVSKMFSGDVAVVYPPNARIQLRRPTVVSRLTLGR